MTETTFACQLIKARAIAGLSQAALAQKSGISAAQISRYETGMNDPRPGTKYRLADALGIKDGWGDEHCTEPAKTVDVTALSTVDLMAELARRCS